MSRIKHESSDPKDIFSFSAGENPAELERRVDSLVDQYIKIWWKLCGKPATRHGESTDARTKRKRQADTDAFIDAFILKIESYPPEVDRAAQWKTQISHLMEDFISKMGYIRLDEVRFLLSSGILQATEVFVKQAREFDAQIKFEDIGQAMRNVWIMNISQLLLDQEILCTPSVFSYSMLYPYTDNYIDDVNIAFESKKSYSSRFERRLSGEAIKAENAHEEKIFALVELVETEFKRSEFPYVYESLIRIHKAQNKSILQHHKGITPYDTDILGVSFEKGGTSVLADAFLVKGELTQEEMDFFFVYGLMLQLCDDLQDVKEDLKNGHHTVFSLTAKKWPLDTITDALFNLVEYTVELIGRFDVEHSSMIQHIFMRNCCLLVYFAIEKNKEFYSRSYFKSIRPYLPYNPSYMNRFYKKLSKKFNTLKSSYNGISTEKILLEALR